MKLLVCVSKTPDTTAKIAFADNNTRFDPAGVQHIMNPYDEWYALVRAIELKEQEGGTITVINVGPAENDVIIRKALAIGADEAVRIDGDPISAQNTAYQISEFAKEQGFDIIFTGKETINYNGSEVGGMVAEYLDLPFVSYAYKMEYSEGISKIRRDIEGGVEVVEVEGPLVVSASKGLAEQRIPNMRGIMMAKRKPLQVVEMKPFTHSSKVISFSLPDEKTGVKLIDPENMDELVKLLHEEAKVI
jgi:electron transfer flavoprotein beta subunit